MPGEGLLLVYGGRSSEHEVSIRTAKEVLAAVDRTRFEVSLLGIRRDGGFRTGPLSDDLEHILSAGEVVNDLPTLLSRTAIVFPLLHGPNGEDGSFQGLLESYDCAYVGSGVLASSLCMDKAAFKRFVAASPDGVPVVPDISLDFQVDHERNAFASARSACRRLRYPVFVKPANQGSSVGITKVDEEDGLEQALRLAASYDPRVLIERGVDGREVEVAVLGDGGPNTLVSQPGEIVLPENSWYDYEAKYESDVARLEIPAQLPTKTAERLRGLALQAFRLVGAYGLARVDFFVERVSMTPYLNEVNTMPGFTSISMYPKLMDHFGIAYPELISRLVDLGIQRHTQRRKLRHQR